MPTSTEPEGMPAWLPGDLPEETPPDAKTPAETGAEIPSEIRADAPAEVLPDDKPEAEPATDQPEPAPAEPAPEPTIADAQALEHAPDAVAPEAGPDDQAAAPAEPGPVADDESAVSDPQALEAAVDIDEDDDDEDEDDDDDFDEEDEDGEDEDDEDDDDEATLEEAGLVVDALVDDAVEDEDDYDDDEDDEDDEDEDDDEDEEDDEADAGVTEALFVVEEVVDTAQPEAAVDEEDDDSDDDDDDDEEEDDDEDEEDEDDDDGDEAIEAEELFVVEELVDGAAPEAGLLEEEADEDDDDDDEDDDDEDDEDEDDEEIGVDVIVGVLADDDEREPDPEELAAAFIIDGDASDADALADLLSGAEDGGPELVVLVTNEDETAAGETLEEVLADVLATQPTDAETDAPAAEPDEVGLAEPVLEQEVQQSGPAPELETGEPPETAREAAAELAALADGTLPEGEITEEAEQSAVATLEDVLMVAPEGATSAEMVTEPYPPAAEAAPAEIAPAEAPAEPPAPAPAKPARKRGKKAKAEAASDEAAVSPEAVAAGAEALATAEASAAEAPPDEPMPDFNSVVATDESLVEVTPLNLEAQLEALLFVAESATPIDRLAEALEIKPREVEAALAALAESLKGRGISLQRFRDRVQLTTAPSAAGRVERFLGLAAATPLSRAALEALAIIAYQQPVTRPQIEAVRGVNSDSVIKNLLTKGLVEENGRAEGPGRPVLYSTTPEFMQHFGLASLSDLPPLTLPEAKGPAAPTADELLKG